MAMDMKDGLNQVEARVAAEIKQQRGNKKDLPFEAKFDIGDVVDVGVKIIEGDKSRTQIFNGRVIAKRGGGLRSYFTVRRIVDNEGVERDFPLYAPTIEFIKVKAHGKARRAKLFYLRERVGKQTRLREVLVAEEQEAAKDETKKKGKKRGAKAKAERATRAAEMDAKKAEARRKKRAAKKAEKAGAGGDKQG